MDFELVQVDPKSGDNDDLEYAITSIKRNGVAIKGTVLKFRIFSYFLGGSGLPTSSGSWMSLLISLPKCT